MNMDYLCDDVLERLWRDTDWVLAEETLIRLQREIAQAAAKRNVDVGEVRAAQDQLVNSVDARLLAVRHVCDSVAQAGIDDVRWDTAADKMRAAFALTAKDYRAMPMRLVVIRPKGQTKTRHIQIPTFYDRAMQTLYAYALDPVAESTGEKKSFAFRRGRSMQDVHAFILRGLEGENPPKWLIKADVKACYASISHEWLLRHIPMDSDVLTQFLKAGHVFCGELFPPDDFGISLGSSISPILGNMTLDGAQRAIYDGLCPSFNDDDYADGNLIRFADDMLITARTRDSAEEIMDILRSFLAERGLMLSGEKTRIIDLTDGFDFLSRHYQYHDGYVAATPSDTAVAKFELELRDLISGYHGGQKQLIDKLNRKLVGWATYHKATDATEAFRRIDAVVKTSLLELCKELSPRLSRERIISKYFYLERDGQYVYALENKPDVRLRRLADTILVKHQPVVLKKNPYLDDEYYEGRTDERAIMSVTGKYRQIWARQSGRCYYCGKRIIVGEKKGIVPIDPTQPDNPKSSAYIHAYCQRGQAEFYDTDYDITSRFDLHELLMRLKNNEKPLFYTSKFLKLAEYFRQRTEPVFTLTFADIEKILGRPLCASARKYLDYWYRNGERKISRCWLSHGYRIRTPYLDKCRMVFEREKDIGEAVWIPEVFLIGRIPPDAKAEMEILIDYIRKKYGI